jgi:Peptidase family M23
MALGLVVNPWLIGQVLAQSFGQLYAVGTALVKRRLMLRSTRLTPPFSGTWEVLRGGVTKKDSHSWSVVSQRFGYDFVVTERGATCGDRGRRLEDYYAFGQPVIAPSNGVVVETADHHRDYPHPGTGWIDWRTSDIRGNHVLLKHDDGTWSMIAHLRRGTCRVRPGDRVRRGELLGECGNSGHSTEPHIHLHTQNRRSMYLALGCPIQFESVRIVQADKGGDSGETQSRPPGWVSAGDSVTSLSPDVHVESSPSPELPMGCRVTMSDAAVAVLTVGANLALVYFVVRLWLTLVFLILP